MGARFRSLGIRAARAADEKNGKDIVLRNVDKHSPLAEYLLVVTAGSRPEMEAIEYEIRRRFKEDGIQLVHRDGSESDLWRILDYGGLLVHLMHPQAREFYSIDKLFHEARRVGWEDGGR